MGPLATSHQRALDVIVMRQRASTGGPPLFYPLGPLGNSEVQSSECMEAEDKKEELWGEEEKINISKVSLSLCSMGPYSNQLEGWY